MDNLGSNERTTKEKLENQRKILRIIQKHFVTRE